MKIVVKFRKPNTGAIFVLPTIVYYIKDADAPSYYTGGIQIHWLEWAIAIYLRKNITQ